MWKKPKGILFHLFPHHLVSKFTFWLTRLESPLKNLAIRLFIRAFDIDMSEYELQSPEQFPNFNQFFIRKLQAGARPIDDAENTIICPADGTISQIGTFESGQAIQAKGQPFSMAKLLACKQSYGFLCESGNYATIYLSPRNYHRVHMPYAGKLLMTIRVPGRLFSVAPYATEVIRTIYSRNERVISIFSTDIGYMAVVMVGAVNVSAIEMAWEDLTLSPREKKIIRKEYDHIELKKGDELGVFNMGSTAIMVFEHDRVTWQAQWLAQQEVRMGQTMGLKKV